MLGQIISRNRLKVTIGRLRLNGVRIRLEECVLHWFCKLEILECLPISRRIVSSISGIMCGKSKTKTFECDKKKLTSWFGDRLGL